MAKLQIRRQKLSRPSFSRKRNRIVIRFELYTRYCTHRVISEKVHPLFVALSDFRPDRFVQFLSIIPILILLLHLLVSTDLVYTGIYELVLGVFPEGEQL